METLVVNLFGSPCSGKTKLAHHITDKLKECHLNVEFVPEIAKQYLWAGRTKELLCQPSIFGRQLENMNLLYGQVDYIIMDSPILLSAIYSSGWPESFKKSVIDIHNMYNSINFFLQRGNWEYNDKHRREDIDNDQISEQIISLFLKNDIEFYNLSQLSGRESDVLELLEVKRGRMP